MNTCSDVNRFRPSTVARMLPDHMKACYEDVIRASDALFLPFEDCLVSRILVKVEATHVFPVAIGRHHRSGVAHHANHLGLRGKGTENFWQAENMARRFFRPNVRLPSAGHQDGRMLQRMRRPQSQFLPQFRAVWAATTANSPAGRCVHTDDASRPGSSPRTAALRFPSSLASHVLAVWNADHQNKCVSVLTQTDGVLVSELIAIVQFRNETTHDKYRPMITIGFHIALNRPGER